MSTAYEDLRKELIALRRSLVAGGLEGVEEIRKFVRTYHTDDPEARARVHGAGLLIKGCNDFFAHQNNALERIDALGARAGYSGVQTIEVVKANGLLLPESFDAPPDVDNVEPRTKRAQTKKKK